MMAETPLVTVNVENSGGLLKEAPIEFCDKSDM